MKTIKQKKRTNLTRFFMKAILVVVSTALIVYFMPRGDEFGYKYELNRPWNYGLLIANTKFPILKNDSLIHQEKETTMRDFQPYYNYNKVVRDTMMNRLYNEAAMEWQGENSTVYVHHIAALLDTIYKRGVLSGEDYARMKDDEHHKSIRIVKDNEAESVPLSRVFSLRSAYDYIITEDASQYSSLVLRQFNINELIQQNLTYDKLKSETELDENLQNISSYNGFVQAGQKIVDRGETVTDEVYDILHSYEKDYERRNTIETKIPYRSIGQTIFVLVIFVSLITYLSLFRVDYFENVRNVTLLFALPVFFCVVASLMVSHKILNVFMLPCCLVPIVIRVFMDSRTAFMFHCGMVLIISMMLTNNYEFIIVQLVAGMVAIQTLRELSQRSQIVRTAFILFLVYVIFYTGYSLHHENDIKMDTWMYVCFTVNCVLLLFTYPLLWMLEKMFGFTSDVTLVELSNVHNPLLQRMTEVAPGTFQHSMQVANLSAEVANKIGGKAQLVRTGALYHDIGKMERPAFFTENQNGVSPHKHLTPLKSAEVIIAHVKNITYKNEHPDEKIDEKVFSYPGPNPSTKEEAILMMCDAVEAASRSLPEYTEDSINQLVDKIIDNQVAEGFFSECSITFKDIATAKMVLKDKLKTIYHTRISYPELGEDYENREEK